MLGYMSLLTQHAATIAGIIATLWIVQGLFVVA
jgi:hypothetical protein